MRSSKTIADHPVAALLSALLVADGSRSCYELDGAVHCRDEKHYFREKARREVRELEDSYSRNQRKSLTVPREHQEEPADRKVDMQGQVLETKNCERSLLMTNHNAVTYRRPFRFSAMNEGGISALQALPSSETQQLRRSYRLQRSEEPKTRKNAVNQFDSICVPHVRSEEAHAIRFSGGFLDVATELAHVAAMFTVGTHSEMRAEVVCVLSRASAEQLFDRILIVCCLRDRSHPFSTSHLTFALSCQLFQKGDKLQEHKRDLYSYCAELSSVVSAVQR